MVQTTRITINLPVDTLENARNFCNKTGRTLSGFIKYLIEEYIDKMAKEEFKSASEIKKENETND